MANKKYYDYRELLGLTTLEALVANQAVQFNLGNDATGDIYYRGADGNLVRLAIDTDESKILGIQSGVPAWVAGEDLSFEESDPVANAKTITLVQGLGTNISGAATQTLSSNPSWTITSVHTANNGITANTGQNVQLGGNIIQNTALNLTSNTGLSITGSSLTTSLTITNPATLAGGGMLITAGSFGMKSTGDTFGIIAESKNTVLNVISTKTASVGTSPNNNSSILFTRTATPLIAGDNISEAFSSAVFNTIGYRRMVITNPSTTVGTTEYQIHLAHKSVDPGPQLKFSIKSDGDLFLPYYANDRDDGEATKFLSTDADGNVILCTLPPVSDGYTDEEARGSINMVNGLTYDSTTGYGKLGGLLIENTTIGLASFGLNMTSSANTATRYNFNPSSLWLKAANTVGTTYGQLLVNSDFGSASFLLSSPPNNTASLHLDTSFAQLRTINNGVSYSLSLDYSGLVNIDSLKTSGGAPSTTGTIRPVVVDQNGRLSYSTFPVGSSGTVTSVSATVTASTALSVSGSPITTAGTLAFTWTGTTGQYIRGNGTLATFPTDLAQFTNGPGYITSYTETDPTVPAHVKAITTTNIANWNTAYNNEVTGIAFTGTTTKTLTLTQRDGGTLTASFTDIDTNTTSLSVRDEGTSIVSTNAINFVGANVAVTNVGGVATVTITGGSGTSDGNNYPTALHFETENGNLYLSRNGLDNLITNLDGRYLVSFVEEDPIFTAHPAFVISNTHISNWNTAFAERIVGFTLHAGAGSANKTLRITLANATTFDATFDDIFSSGGASDGNNFPSTLSFSTATGVLTLGRTGLTALTVDLDGRYLQSFTETDPVAVAKTISLTAGAGVSLVGTTTQALNVNPSWTISHADTSSIAAISTVGAQIISSLTFDTFGHATASSVRTLTRADIGAGTVNSVAASISGALSVSGTPITNTGTLVFAWTGTTSQYVRGDGTLATYSPGETNLGANLGGGLANYASKSGVTLQFNTFAASDFDLAANLISIDATLKSNWNTAYNNTVVSGAYSAGTITLTQQDGGTVSITGIPTGGGSGTVTSVNASISGALSVSGGPITSSGTLAFVWGGTTAQYVRGDGSLATFPTVGEVNTGANLGGGLANYASKSGSALQFNTFNTSHFDLTSNLISIDATLVSNWNTASNKYPEAVDVSASGNNRTLTLTLNDSTTLSDTFTVGEVNTASNLGAGTGLFAQKSSADLQFKSLKSSDGSILISSNSTEVDIKSQATGLVVVTGSTAGATTTVLETFLPEVLSSGMLWLQYVGISTTGNTIRGIEQVGYKRNNAGTTTLTFGSDTYGPSFDSGMSLAGIYVDVGFNNIIIVAQGVASVGISWKVTYIRSEVSTPLP